LTASVFFVFRRWPGSVWATARCCSWASSNDCPY